MKKIFSLDVRRARKGDCLLLHFGTDKDPGLVMIDGGPKSVYKPHLKPRLEEIRAMRGLEDDESLPVDLLMISHVDDDHIQGILDLTKEEITKANAAQPQLLNVLEIWHNSFDEIIDHTPDELTASISSHFGQAALDGGGIPDDALAAVESQSTETPEVVESSMKVLASISQGFQLRRDVQRLNIPLNDSFGGKLILAEQGGGAVDMSNNLELTVIGPMKPEVQKLHEDHIKWLKKLKKEHKSPPAALAAYVDKSVPNLSSIVVLAKSHDKTILLTGDARGDKILEGLELTGTIQPGGKLKVDILKVPHHGSDNNLDDDFFERIIAKHYVFSGDGEHGNPERKALEMLFNARGSDPFTVHLTYPIAEIDAGRKADWLKHQEDERKKGKKVRPNWSPTKQGLVAFFNKHPLAAGQKIEIADKTKPHIIDLLDKLQ